ncbi:IclR family transcriptional regulator [Stakelama saccharophila]|uniref:IclR family transcriptional regulator n=1 Tax=Stakelama saccharophila TaxID=3075605 RepID=A0ABZ0B5U3_9SPHN|nr:IclR family transcriptional regulator [Stakelama sp. W311]WNO52375.1 IclR family transcriptional regulator [Stakelama sp. W311]
MKRGAMETNGGGARKGQYSAPALEKGFDVFELLAGFPEGLTISEIAARLDRSINELFRLIVVMERRGYLRKDSGTDRYSVAYKILDIAYRATPVQNLTHIAAPVMYDLARSAAQSCHLVVISEGCGLVVAREENPGPTSFGVRLGARVDLFESCSGNVLLAFTDADRIAAIVPRGRDGKPRSTTRLSAALRRIRRQGHERRQSPMTYGVIDISHPIFGFDGHIAAALTIPFLERIDGSHPVAIDDVQAFAADAAARISAGLGWHGEDVAAH